MFQHVISVNRAMRPDFLREWMFDERCLNTPDFIEHERLGPPQYVLESLVEQEFPAGEDLRQPRTEPSGMEIWRHQYQLGIGGCLSVADLIAIKKQVSIDDFRDLFGHKMIFALRSMAWSQSGLLRAPGLTYEDGKLWLSANNIGTGIGPYGRILRFAD